MTSKMCSVWLALAFVLVGPGCSRNERAEDSQPVTPAPASATHESHDAMQEAHAEHAAHKTAPALEPGQRWATDEPLRTAMQRIRDATDRATSVPENRPLTSAEAHALAATVDENIAYMITNCKLEPKPDAALHVLIGRMSAAAASIRKDPESDTGLPQLHAALSDYQSTFDHPGWLPLTATRFP